MLATSRCTRFLLFSFGFLMWLVHGLLIHSVPMILANSVTLGLALAILVLKFPL
ncbi:hypothetical protein [Alloacidobacterium dinghuense]|uniref:hypothetical protein n=1 Tax=Alloacidobacterium dinghuense TaxID=2763107 RepID=UPI00203750D3|nr:hypothetical protein [Alloacidobacterium dinghuense]